ncbi:MAG: hypothetical protein JXA14_06665 [Anaerolineae bacterium]|nr:hypothetical protein [Anaerolineae bacterium]
MNENEVDLMVIPSISDPRNTVTSLAMFQNAFDIAPRMPIVVIYGTCSDPYRALGEGGKPLRDREPWEPPWTSDRWKELRQRFGQVADHDGIPVYFFDDLAQRRAWEGLTNAPASLEGVGLPDGVTKEDFVKCVEGIFGATYSYGAQRNKAFIAANNLGAHFVFFFDDDTFLAPHVGNMIDRHRHLLEQQNVYAVTGGYFGQRAFNATIFRTIDQQQEFMGLLGYEIPDDQATQDLWGWRMGDGVLGGNFCLKKEVYRAICCPSMHRTPTTDDKLIGREIRRVFGRDGHVYKTGWPVVHVHFPHRMNPDQVNPYLRSWAKTKAFWVLYDKLNGTESRTDREGQTDLSPFKAEASTVVSDFGNALSGLAEEERRQAGGELAEAIVEAAETIVSDSDTIVQTVINEMKEYDILKRCWPTIIEVTRAMDIWTHGKNHFVPQ